MSSSHGYLRKLSQALNDLRKQNQLCDIIINVGGRAFHAHKNVLAASSSYFLAMFTSGFKEGSQTEVTIDGKAEIFEVLLEFAYTGDLKIRSETAYDVLDMACYMQFTDVCSACSDFIARNYNSSHKIPVGDVFKISQLARNHHHKYLKQLAEKLETYMEENVQELKGSDAFLQNASIDFLKEFLSREDLSSLKQEKQVLEMVVSWLKYDWENRRTHSLCLLEKVRLGLVPSENLKELLDAEILEIPECQVLLDHVLQLQSSTKSMTKLSLKHPELFATRSTITAPISLYIDENYSYSYTRPDCEHTLQYFKAETRYWGYLSKFPKLPYSSSLIVVEGILCAAGGLEQVAESEYDDSDSDTQWDSDGEKRYSYHTECHRKFLCYNSAQNKWDQMPQMNKARHKFPLVYLDDFIYAIGGLNESKVPMSDAERYDMAKREWQLLPSLPEGYRWVSVVVFRGKILVYGVSTRISKNPLTSELSRNHMLQVFHPTTGTWQMALSEQHEASNQRVLFIIEPAVVIHKDVCYRVLYHTQKNSRGEQPWHWYSRTQPSVNILEYESQSDDDISVAVGEEVNQDYIPANIAYAFRINDEVFVSDKGFVYKTDVEIGPDQSADVSLHGWERFKDSKEHTNVTWFTFDRKSLTH